MPETSFVAAGAEYLWQLRYALLLAVAFCLLMVMKYGYRAYFLWKHRDAKFLDPVIAEAMKGGRRPRYTLLAIGWLVAAALLVCAAFVAIA